MDENQKKMNRRKALKYIAVGAAAGIGTILYNKISAKKIKEEAENGTIKMATRPDKASGKPVSLLGYGCMRFPTYNTGQKDARGRDIWAIDMEKSQELIDYAYANGVNYYDTAYNYHGGESAPAIGKMLKKYDRDSFFLANKMPSWMIQKPEDLPRIFQEQLDKCGVEYFDYYLLHALSDKKVYDKAYEECGGYEYLAKEKEAGRIKNLGFSFHGDEKLFDYMIDKHPWDFVQLQINYIDWKGQNSEYYYKELEKRNIPCIIMEPLKGGMLSSLNKDADEILTNARPGETVASWAFRYAGSLPLVVTVLSGMTKMEHLKDNLKTFDNFKPLTDKEREILDSAIKEFYKIPQIGCTACRYCMPCQYGVDIPGVFAFYNRGVKESIVPDINGEQDAKFDRKKRAFTAAYKNTFAQGNGADKCISCGKCVEMCPQKLDIPTLMSNINSFIE